MMGFRILNRLRRYVVASAVAGLLGVGASAASWSTIKTVGESAMQAVTGGSSVRVPAAGTVEVAFSPREGAEALVVKVIDSAKRELRVLAYSFTSAPITEALLRAKRRGVDVKVVVDSRNNLSEDRSGKARAALSALANASIDVRTISVYAIHHDKVIVADGETVEQGSFNYSASAESRNSENVVVNWGNRPLAAAFLTHFERNYRQSAPFVVGY